MRTVRTALLARLPMLALSAETAPAGLTSQGCGVHAVDADLRAAFENFDRNQSRSAAKICALYLNRSNRF